jgi:hypothetical protein
VYTGPHDTQHKDTQHNYSQYYDTHDAVQLNNTQHNNKNAALIRTTHKLMVVIMLSLTTLIVSINPIMLSVLMLSVVMLSAVILSVVILYVMALW